MRLAIAELRTCILLSFAWTERAVFFAVLNFSIRANCYVSTHLDPDFPLAGLAGGLFVGLMGAGKAQIAVLLLTLFLP